MVENWMEEKSEKRRTTVGIFAVMALLLIGVCFCILLMSVTNSNNEAISSVGAENLITSQDHDIITNNNQTVVKWNVSGYNTWTYPDGVSSINYTLRTYPSIPSCQILVGVSDSPLQCGSMASCSTNIIINNTSNIAAPNKVVWNESEWQINHPNTFKEIPSWCRDQPPNGYGQMQFVLEADQPTGAWVNCENNVTVSQYVKNKTSYYWKNQTKWQWTPLNLNWTTRMESISAGGGPGVPGEQPPEWVAPNQKIVNYTPAIVGYYGFKNRK
jgi:hypothetical protein